MSGQLPRRTLFCQDFRQDFCLLRWLAETGMSMKLSSWWLCWAEMRPPSTATPACYYHTRPAISVLTLFTEVERQYLPLFSIVFLKEQAKKEHPVGFHWDSSLCFLKGQTLPQPYKPFCFPAHLCDAVSSPVCSFSKQGPSGFSCCRL